MLASQGASQGLESIQIIVVAFAVAAAIFWRAVLRIALTIAAILLVLLVTSGAIAIFEGIHHVIK